MALQDTYDALLLDLDGTVWEGGDAIEHAVEAINAAGVPAVYITNNASRSAAEVAQMLRAIGLQAQDNDVLTSAQAALGLAEEHLSPGDPVLVLGAPSFRDLVANAGYRVVDSADENPKVVLHGHNPETGWHQLSEAALSIARGAVYLASNLDTTLPMQRGLMVGNGSMVAAVTSATGVTPRAAGKPEPAMFLQAAGALGAKRPLAVGDRMDTDIAGAVAAGIPALHVLTGVSGPLALIEAPKELRPTFIAEDMRALAQDAEQLKPSAQGGFGARVDGRDIILSHGNEGATSIQALRTVLEVAWMMDTPPELVRPNSDAAEAATANWW
ncbi:HAD-IIA family hydrolase [Corynebacterium riegelii]|uniref:HAD family hydrolase n=1 Tax=Corynebacterium riegelii TaxID=156976 RepID=A0A0K1RAK5_9CORY|nr:HAD-IIA family hydrolase [Corynebacterium riegelii]AKV58444.1 HAD family hydrolase [Corynebacterium riegelii]PLA13550.1 HAD family hydrolase [Corynebacterium riegelii]QQU83514.1 HAD-IIA family hydrolase [Corynebacterium riegelii]